MNAAKSLWIASAFAATLLAGAQSTQAQATQLTGPFSGGTVTPAYPNGTPVTGNGNDTNTSDTALNSGFTLLAGTNLLTFTTSDGSDFTRHDAGSSTGVGNTTAFPDNTPLLESIDPNGTSSNGNGPVTISFRSPVDEFSLSAQDFTPDTETFKFFAFNGATNVGSFTVGPVDNNNPKGQAAFLGAAYAPGITSVLISSTSDQPFGSNDFYVGPVSFRNAPVPEASTTVSLGLMLGLGGLGLLVSRRRKRAASGGI